MRLAVLSDTRLPTRADGGHGLGMSAHAIATGLARRGHDVTLLAGKGSIFRAGRLRVAESEEEHARTVAANAAAFDAILDTSHYHTLSMLCPDCPVVNRLCDLERTWQPPNAVVNSAYMRERHPQARLVRTGIAVDEIPFCEEHDGYAAFVGPTYEPQRGHSEARRVAEEAGLPLRVINGLSKSDKWRAFGRASVLLHPSRLRAAPRTPLEFAACGVPTLCLDGDGTREHVEHGVTGFICADWTEMVGQVDEVGRLDRRRIRAWAADTHGYEQMTRGYEALLQATARGERW